MSSASKDEEIDQKIMQIINARKPQSVKQLLILAQEELQIPEKELLDTILKLQNEGKITFKKQPHPTPNFLAYLKTEQALWYWTTITTAIITAAIVFIIPENLYPWVYIRYFLGAIFVLWLPGYTLIKALFPTEVPLKTSKESLNTIERVALSLGMSLVLVPIVGLLLNYTPWGIRLTPIVLSLLVLAIVFATAAIIREHQAAMKQ